MYAIIKKNIKNTNLPNSLYPNLLLLFLQMISYISHPILLTFGRNYRRSIGILVIISLTQMVHNHREYPSGHHRSCAMTSKDA